MGQKEIVTEKLKNDKIEVAQINYINESSINTLKDKVKEIQRYISPLSSMSVEYLRKALIPINNIDGRSTEGTKEKKFKESRKLIVDEISDTLERMPLFKEPSDATS